MRESIRDALRQHGHEDIVEKDIEYQNTQFGREPVEETFEDDGLELPDYVKPHSKSMLREVKEAVIKREKEFETDVSKYTEESKTLKAYLERPDIKELDEALSRFDAPIKEHNITRGKFVGNLLNAHAALSRPDTKNQAFAQIAHSYGVDIQHINNPAYAQHLASQARQVNPQPQQTQQQQTQIPAELAQNGKSIAESFAQTHKHFSDERVKQAMFGLIQSGIVPLRKDKSGFDAVDLEAAYRKAIGLYDLVDEPVSKPKQIKQTAPKPKSDSPVRNAIYSTVDGLRD